MKNIKLDVKKVVRETYGQIANQSKEYNQASCCGASSCCDTDYSVFGDDYSHLKGYNQDADLGLGCGLPTEYAKMKEGDTVLDLGSGAGNDCFVARAEVGEKGRVIGLDFTPEMLKKANENVQKVGFTNVEFVQGDIEEMPLENNLVDVVISNCVLNLVSDKSKAFEEIFRVLKPGAHFSISDVVLKGELPDSLTNAAEMYAGCVSGAMQKDEYLEVIRKAGFINIEVQNERDGLLPDKVLLEYLSEEELKAFKESGTGIYSVTVFAVKPE